LKVPGVKETARSGIERGSGFVLWKQIEERLVAEIAEGGYREGRFPTEQTLSRRFGVNRHTVRRALAGLVQRGMLRVEQGRGAFLIEDAIDYTVGSRTRFTENLLRQGRQPGHVFLEIEEEAAPPEIARALRIRAGAAVVRIASVSTADGRPVSVGEHYFPAERLPGIAEALRETGSVTRALARIGHGDYRRKSTRITARMPDAREMRHLKLPAVRPVLVAESLNVDARDRPIQVGTASFAADRVQFVLET